MAWDEFIGGLKCIDDLEAVEFVASDLETHCEHLDGMTDIAVSTGGDVIRYTTQAGQELFITVSLEHPMGATFTRTATSEEE